MTLNYTPTERKYDKEDAKGADGKANGNPRSGVRSHVASKHVVKEHNREVCYIEVLIHLPTVYQNKAELPSVN